MRIATYNIRHGAPAGRSADHRGLARTCARLAADVLALQEVDRRVVRSRWVDQVRVVARATGLRPVFVSARPLGPFGEYGIALFTRVELGAVEFVRLPAFGTEQRMAIIGRVDAGDGRKVTIAATHLQNRRSVATRQLAIVLDRLDRRNGPAVLVGDLNLGESDVTPALGARGYSWAHSGPTFPAAAPDRTIDWIGGRGVSIDGTEAVPSLQSDHLPLLASVSVGPSTPV